jgi:hypothetical protein
MAAKLSWDDLLIQRLPPEKAGAWIEYWSGWVSGRVAPIAMSKFGDWFLRREDGSTDELSVIEGTLDRIAGTPAEFANLMNQPKWQEDHLLSWQVSLLHEKGLVPRVGECYALAPHPSLTGKIRLEHAIIMDIGVWQAICSDTLGGKSPLA